MHAMGNVIDMRRFGGLRHIMPWTHRTFLVGCLALAGVFPFAGFWSKDQIVAAVHSQTHAEHADALHAESSGRSRPDSGLAPRGVVGEQRCVRPRHRLRDSTEKPSFVACISPPLFTAFLTAFYTFRAYFMTFFGPEEVPDEAGHHAHESPPLMVVPLMILAIFAFGVGFVFEIVASIRRLSGDGSVAGLPRACRGVSRRANFIGTWPSSVRSSRCWGSVWRPTCIWGTVAKSRCWPPVWGPCVGCRTTSSSSMNSINSELCGH